MTKEEMRLKVYYEIRNHIASDVIKCEDDGLNALGKFFRKYYDGMKTNKNYGPYKEIEERIVSSWT